MTYVYSQDKLPISLSPDQITIIPEKALEYRLFSKPIAVNNSLPASFKNTKENVIIDADNSLVPVYEKLKRMEKPLRIVHIGDSHIRGHILPLTVRRNFERDFGTEATYTDTITYASTALARETGKPGVVYHAIGINGATCLNFTNVMQVQEITNLKPDLIIMSFGTNESHGKGYNATVHECQMNELINMLRAECPDAAILLTTPPGSYLRYRRRKSINTRTPLVAQTIVDFAGKHHFACWDMYSIVGGKTSACLNWVNNKFMQKDQVHYIAAGYRLQGNLLYEAFIKAYNNYVAD